MRRKTTKERERESISCAAAAYNKNKEEPTDAHGDVCDFTRDSRECRALGNVVILRYVVMHYRDIISRPFILPFAQSTLALICAIV